MLSYGVLYTTLQSFARYQYWLPTDRPQCRTHGVCPWDACRMPRQTTQWLSARLCTSDAQGAPTFDLNSTNGTLLPPAVFRGVEKNKKIYDTPASYLHHPYFPKMLLNVSYNLDTRSMQKKSALTFSVYGLTGLQ